MLGIVKFFKNASGFGFIWPLDEMAKPERPANFDVSNDDSSKYRSEIFFHNSNVLPDEHGVTPFLVKEDEVEFDITDGPKGPMANDIRVVKSVRETRKTSLPVTSITLSIKKDSVAILVDMVEDFVNAENTQRLGLSEKEKGALEDLQRSLKQCQARMVSNNKNRS